VIKKIKKKLKKPPLLKESVFLHTVVYKI